MSVETRKGKERRVSPCYIAKDRRTGTDRRLLVMKLYKAKQARFLKRCLNAQR